MRPAIEPTWPQQHACDSLECCCICAAYLPNNYRESTLRHVHAGHLVVRPHCNHYSCAACGTRYARKSQCLHPTCRRWQQAALSEPILRHVALATKITPYYLLLHLLLYLRCLAGHNCHHTSITTLQIPHLSLHYMYPPFTPPATAAPMSPPPPRCSPSAPRCCWPAGAPAPRGSCPGPPPAQPS
jgi:hypothetical protein